MSTSHEVAFVCLHGSAKILIAAEYFNRLVREQTTIIDVELGGRKRGD